MAGKFTSIWNDGRKGRVRGSPGAASAATDSESGEEGDDTARRSLRALKIMFDRGLMTRDEYDARRTALLKAAGDDAGR